MKVKFLEILQEALETEDLDISLDDKLSDFDAWDSMSRLSLIALLDEHFEIEVADSEFENVNTVDDLYKLIKHKLA